MSLRKAIYLVMSALPLGGIAFTAYMLATLNMPFEVQFQIIIMMVCMILTLLVIIQWFLSDNVVSKSNVSRTHAIDSAKAVIRDTLTTQSLNQAITGRREALERIKARRSANKS